MPKHCGRTVEDLRTSKFISQVLSTTEQIVYTPHVLKPDDFTHIFTQLKHGLSATKPVQITDVAANLYTKSTGLITTRKYLNNLYY